MKIEVDPSVPKQKKYRKPTEPVASETLDLYVEDVAYILHQMPGLKALEIQERLLHETTLDPCPFIYQVLYYMRDLGYIYPQEEKRAPGVRGRLAQLWFPSQGEDMSKSLGQQKRELEAAKKELVESFDRLKGVFMDDLFGPLKASFKKALMPDLALEKDIPALTLVQEDYSKVLEYFMSHSGEYFVASFLEAELDISSARMYRTLNRLYGDLQIDWARQESLPGRGRPERNWIYQNEPHTD